MVKRPKRRPSLKGSDYRIDYLRTTRTSKRDTRVSALDRKPTPPTSAKMSASSSPVASSSSVPKIPKLKWGTAAENEKLANRLVKDDTWLLTHVLNCSNNTTIRLRAGNRKYALNANKEAYFDEKKKLATDLTLFRVNRYKTNSIVSGRYDSPFWNVVIVVIIAVSHASFLLAASSIRSTDTLWRSRLRTDFSGTSRARKTSSTCTAPTHSLPQLPTRR